MVPTNLMTFFLASAGVAGALTGLLFVALSVAAPRLAGSNGQGQVHRIRARAALTAFTNSLVVSLFALLPGHQIGPTALATGVAGLVFVLASLLSMTRLLVSRRRDGTRPRAFLHELGRAVLEALQGHGSVLDLLFLIGLVVVFIVEAAQGVDLLARPADSGSVVNLSVLVVACFLIGISRCWELIGGPNLGVWQQVASMVGQHEAEERSPDRR